MYSVKIPKAVQKFKSELLWRVDTDQKILYLTFDDGPAPDVTPRVLDLLKKYGAEATFFCVGRNIEKYPDIFQSILNGGHLVANHTYDHRSGLESGNFSYFKSFMKTEKLHSSGLFRPPYGRISPAQIKALKKRTRIVMWDVLSGDFDKKLTARRCADNVIKNAKPGSVVVFHDSLKARDRVLPALETVLNVFQERGYRFEKIPERKVTNYRREK